MPPRIVRPTMLQIDEHLGAIVDIVRKLTPRQRRALQKRVDGLSQVNCWYVTYAARDFLRDQVAYVRRDHFLMCRRKPRKKRGIA